VTGVSTLPAAKAFFIDLFSSAPDLDGVTVTYGDPGINKIENEHIFIGGTGQEAYSWAPFGKLTQDEQYTLKTYIHTARPGKSQQEATERAFFLFGVMQGLIRPLARTSTTIAPGMYGVMISPTALTEFVLDLGYGAFLALDIDLKARI
jgi:hypothetical protein